MKGDIEGREQHPGKAGWVYRFTVAFLLLGILATFLLVWTYLIGVKQRKVFALTHAATDLRVNTALFHLWFEEAITGGAKEDMEKAFSDLEEALALAEVILSGGNFEHGIVLPPLDDPEYRKHGERIKSLLVTLKKIALARSGDPSNGGIGSPLDIEFNAVFREFDKQARTLELLTGEKWAGDQARAGRVQFVMIDAWVVILIVAAAGIFRSERRRVLSEEAALDGVTRRDG